MDKDLQSIQEVRDLVARAYEAQKQFEKCDQSRVDAIVRAIADAALRESPRLAALAVEETGYGIAEDKHIKNAFVCEKVAEYIAPLRTMGIISEDPVHKITEIAVPMGVVAAIIPSTNPTSTAIFKCLISLKAGNGVVLSPHPAAMRCICESARVCADAAVAAGAPEGLIGCMTMPTLEATEALMKHSQVAVILATGGSGLVKAAYSSGKPAYGVGPGNVPAYVDRSANVAKAVRDVLAGKTFDNGTVCASEQSLIVDVPVEQQVVEELKRLQSFILSEEETRRLEAVAILQNGSLNSQIVGKSARWIAEKAGIEVYPGTRCLVVPLKGVGKEFPLSCEKLSPILSYYVVDGWREGCERCKQVLAFGGMGHTLALHCQNPNIIRQFGLEKPAFRIIVNSPATHGAIGLSTSLPPSMTLGCGTYGNNITTDNITPLHLIQVKRLALETSEVIPSWARTVGAAKGVPPTPVSEDRLRATVASLVEAYLASDSQPAAPAPQAVEFVCEQDVRAAIHDRRTIHISSKTIITPAARDLEAAHNVFVKLEI
ncbi:MAG TPA: aldehyde dehydrogenase family protein [Acidobacteriota bacterium]|nr:aldehyde dehydrogenase family protein [Acidobacteriota bacterium]